METKAIELGWFVVKDLKKAITFYTDVVGLRLASSSEEYGWAELEGHEGGAHLGLAQMNEMTPIPPGGNAVITVTVADIHQARKELQEKKANLIGEIMEVPGHVKLQLFTDEDGNHCQLVETL